ncbi:hypothetical protein LMH73_028570 [Vibrio splendidus]|nr:hypothetical protein [Vibrio splendidus]MCC4882491.1 hypothetical protein [Vibrio splendidus]
MPLKSEILIKQHQLLRTILPKNCHIANLCLHNAKPRFYSDFFIKRAIKNLNKETAAYTSFFMSIYAYCVKHKIDHPSISSIQVTFSPSITESKHKLTTILWLLEMFEAIIVATPFAFEDAISVALEHMKTEGIDEKIYLCHEHSNSRQIIVGFERYPYLFAVIYMKSGLIDIRNCKNPLETGFNEEGIYSHMLFQRSVLVEEVIERGKN